MTLGTDMKGLRLATYLQQCLWKPLFFKGFNYQSVNKTSRRDREAYPSEERAAGRSPVRSTANQAAKQHRGAWCFTTQRLVLAIRMCSMREQWNVHRHACPSGYMSQELCSVATNDARPIPASILLNTICVDDPRIPTLGIGGFCIRKTPR